MFLRQPKVETFTFQHCFRIKPNTDGLIIASKHGLFQLLVYPSVLASTHQADVQPGLMLFAVPHYICDLWRLVLFLAIHIKQHSIQHHPSAWSEQIVISQLQVLAAAICHTHSQTG